MRDEEPGIELPKSWMANTYELTGNFKLVAEFEDEEVGAIVRVTPYKTYTQPGFCNAHRIIFVHPEDGVEETAVGMEVEHIEEAEDAALEAMERFSGKIR